VEIAVRSNLANSFCSGIIQTRGGKLFKTPTYYVDQLYSNHSGVWPLCVESEVPSDQLDISASLSSSGKKAHLFTVNSTLDKISTKVDFSALKEKVNQTKVWTVMETKVQGERDVSNSLEDPVRIRIVKSKFDSGSLNFEYVFQPLTVNAMECQLTRHIKLHL
jgi:alpha-L-arabinofuranosidase